LRERDFGQVQHYGGVSPAWPISYEDLEPYYAEAEKLYLVHGHAGEDPTEAPRSGPFPYPAVSHEPRIQQLHDDLERAGLAPFPPPGGRPPGGVGSGKGRGGRVRRVRGVPVSHRGKGGRAGARRPPRRATRERDVEDALEGGAPRDGRVRERRNRRCRGP